VGAPGAWPCGIAKYLELVAVVGRGSEPETAARGSGPEVAAWGMLGARVASLE